MFGWKFHFMRRFFRRVMKPMTVEEAQAKKLLLSKIYFGCSVTIFISFLYQLKQGRLNWLEFEGLIPEEEAKISPAFQYARMLGVQNATVIRIKGADVLNTKDYNKETFDITKHINDEENSQVDNESKFIRI